MPHHTSSPDTDHCHHNDEAGTPPAQHDAGPPAEQGGGILGLITSAIDNAMDVVSGLIELVHAQIQNFFEGLDGTANAIMNFASTFSFTYWDGDSVESMSFTANAVAAYDAESGTGEYAAAVTFAEVGATQNSDGSIDAHAVSVGYAEGGTFATGDDGLFESANSSVLSISAAADDGQSSLIFAHSETHNAAVSLPGSNGPVQPALDGGSGDDLLSPDELAQGLSIAEANSHAGAASSIGNDGLDAAAGASGLGAHLEFDANGHLVDGGIASTTAGAEAHIDDLDDLFGNSGNGNGGGEHGGHGEHGGSGFWGCGQPGGHGDHHPGHGGHHHQTGAGTGPEMAMCG